MKNEARANSNQRSAADTTPAAVVDPIADEAPPELAAPKRDDYVPSEV
jgi:hypothetical protein